MIIPGQVRQLTTGRSIIVLSQWIGDDQWLVALISKDKEPRWQREVRLSGFDAAEAWNYMSMSEATLEQHTTLIGAITETERKYVCQVLFDDIEGTAAPSPEALALCGPKFTGDPDAFREGYLRYEEKALAELAVLDPVWQDIFGLMPVRKYRKHAEKKLRQKKHIKHRRWEDDDWDGGLGD